MDLIKNHHIQEITEDHLVKALDDDAAVFQTLLGSAVYRSFPTQSSAEFNELQPQDKLTPVGVLGNVLQNRKLKFDLKDEGMKLCFKKGWIQVEAECADGSNQVCFLPSQLHKK
jgi:hypothetical protein